MKKILIPVSIGELVDKISILIVKVKKIKDPLSKKNCQDELSILTTNLPPELNPEIESLVKVNRDLYNCLEEQHQLLTNKENGDYDIKDYCEVASKIYKLNVERFDLKKKLNEQHQSEILEQKSY